MLTFTDVPEWLSSRHAECQRLVEELRPTMSSLGSEHRVLGEASLDGLIGDEAVGIVVEGVIRRSANGGLVRFHGDGDVIMRTPPGTILVAEFASRVLVCSLERIRELARRDADFAVAWMTILELEAEIMHSLCGLYVRPDTQPAGSIESFATGERIIVEGAMSQEIYVLLQGEARVDLEGRTVGAIGPNEIFGEMSFLLARPRLATVVAVSPCVVHRVPGDEFSVLLSMRPTLAIDMARTLALRVARLNPRAEAA